MKVTDKVDVPAGRTVPAAGVYANVPATFAVAFNWVLLSAVPCVIAGGAAQLIVDVTFVAVADCRAEAAG